MAFKNKQCCPSKNIYYHNSANRGWGLHLFHYGQTWLLIKTGPYSRHYKCDISLLPIYYNSDIIIEQKQVMAIVYSLIPSWALYHDWTLRIPTPSSLPVGALQHIFLHHLHFLSYAISTSCGSITAHIPTPSPLPVGALQHIFLRHLHFLWEHYSTYSYAIFTSCGSITPLLSS